MKKEEWRSLPKKRRKFLPRRSLAMYELKYYCIRKHVSLPNNWGQTFTLKLIFFNKYEKENKQKEKQKKKRTTYNSKYIVHWAISTIYFEMAKFKIWIFWKKFRVSGSLWAMSVQCSWHLSDVQQSTGMVVPTADHLLKGGSWQCLPLLFHFSVDGCQNSYCV